MFRKVLVLTLLLTLVLAVALASCDGGGVVTPVETQVELPSIDGDGVVLFGTTRWLGNLAVGRVVDPEAKMVCYWLHSANGADIDCFSLADTSLEVGR